MAREGLLTVQVDTIEDVVERDGVRFQFEPMLRSTITVKRLLVMFEKMFW